MKALSIILLTILLAAPLALADEAESERVRNLEERVRVLEEELRKVQPQRDAIDAALEQYLQDEALLDESVARVLKEDPGLLCGKIRLSISGQLWLFFNNPSSDLGLDAGRSRIDMDYLYLFLSADAGPFGFRAWLGLRNTPRYTPDSPWGRYWFQEALVYAKVPTFELADGTKHEVTVEAGKIFSPFSVAWDHSWYGSIIYYKGSMAESDWGLRALSNLPLSDAVSLDYALAYMNRSDDLDGPSSLAGFGLEGTGYQSPEFTDHPDLSEREQRGQFVGRLVLNADLGSGITAALGGSWLTGRIRESEADGSPWFHYGSRTDSLSQTDWDLDLVLTASDVDLGAYVLPQIQLTAEHMWYDRGAADQKGRAYLVELFLRVYSNPDSEWFKALDIWYGYSADNAENQADSRMHLPSLGVRLNDSTRIMFEYVSWKTSDFVIDRGIWVHLAFDF